MCDTRQHEDMQNLRTYLAHLKKQHLCKCSMSPTPEWGVDANPMPFCIKCYYKNDSTCWTLLLILLGQRLFVLGHELFPSTMSAIPNAVCKEARSIEPMKEIDLL